MPLPSGRSKKGSLPQTGSTGTAPHLSGTWQSHHHDQPPPLDDTSASKTHSQQGSGQSRAALKRKKKASRSIDQHAHDVDDDVDVHGSGGEDEDGGENDGDNDDDDDDSLSSAGGYPGGAKKGKKNDSKSKKTKKKKLPHSTHEPPVQDQETDTGNEPSESEMLTLEQALSTTSTDDCVLRSKSLLHQLIAPTSASTFYEKFFDGRQPLLATAGATKSLKSLLLSHKKIEKLLQTHIFTYNNDIEVYRYKTSVAGKTTAKATLYDGDTTVEAKPRDVWNHFTGGHVVKLLGPQKYVDGIWSMLSLLELEFELPVVCSAILVPPKCPRSTAQYDSNDMFVLQVEGSSRWTVHQPTKLTELHRFQYPKVDEVGEGDTNNPSSQPYLDVILQPGDKLFIPRGWVYFQEASSADTPSLVLTLVLGSKDHTVASLVDMLLPQAAAAAAEARLAMRRNLPRGFYGCNGVAHSEDDDNTRRKAFRVALQAHLKAIVSEAMDMIDAAADQLAKEWLQERLPPPLRPQEESQSAAGSPNAIIYPYTVLRMVQPDVARAVVEEGMVVVYHCMDNARETYGAPMSPLEFELDDGPAIEALLNAYPIGIMVSDLPHPSEEMDDKVEVAKALFKEGFLVIEDEASKQNEGGNDDGEDDDGDDPF